MSGPKFKKPNWYPGNDVIATKSGWCYTPNNEILNAIGYLPERLLEAGQDPVTGDMRAAPVSVVLPLVSGVAKAGNTLNGTNGEWSDATSYSVQWESAVASTWSNASSKTLNQLLTEEDVGKKFRLKVVATNDLGSTTVYSVPSSAVVTAIIPLVNTVAPVVSGTAKAGNTLTTNDGTWTGTNTNTYTYAWEQSSNGTTWSVVSGVTSKTLALTESHVGKQFRSKVTNTNALGSVTGVSVSTAKVVTAIVNPTNTAVPTITGTAKAGNTLTGTDGTWTGTPTIAYTYVWEESTNGTTWNVVSGATNKTYALTESHVGKQFRIKVTGTNAGGNSSATSASSGVVVTAIVKPANTVVPAVTGTAKAGNTLTTTDGTWTGTATITYAYAWEQSSNGTTWTVVSGATNKTLALTESHVGKQFRSKITASNAGGSTVANSTATVSVVTALVAPANTAAPVLSGTPEQGSVLSVTNGTWTGSPTITYSYVWQESTDGSVFNNTDVTTSTYTLVESDIDKSFKVIVKATNSVGNTSKESNVVGPVLGLIEE